MKSLTTFLFIFLASSSWRCEEPEDTIDCADAAKQMIGTWKGRTDYTNSSASGTSHNMTLSIISSNDCFFKELVLLINQTQHSLFLELLINMDGLSLWKLNMK